MTTPAVQSAGKTSTSSAPAILKSIPKVEPLTGSIGAEISNVNLGAASRDPGADGGIPVVVAEHKVLFFRDQDITRAEHIAFARHFGDLEDHPMAGSDPDHPGLVRIYKSPDAPMTATRTLGTPMPPGGKSRRSAACCAAWNVRRSAATPCGPTWRSHMRSCRNTSRHRSPAFARVTVSKRPSAPRCRSKNVWR